MAHTPGNTNGLIPPKPPVTLPRSSIASNELALIINSNDPVSVALGAYYQSRRKIPSANVIRVELPLQSQISATTFATIKSKVERALDHKVQAIALAWLKPYRVECQSITSAFALGFDRSKYCSKPCSSTTASAYYDSSSTRPFSDHKIRPTMMLAAVDLLHGKALVDRGLLADNTLPTGKGYFIRTSDKTRSARWFDFKMTVENWDRPGGIISAYIDNSSGGGDNVIRNQQEVLFYLTGLTKVTDLATNSYHPGAIADHLTSAGGYLDGSGQMSAVRWLEGGATGSYGTSSEPCNYQLKFPRASLLLSYYFGGATLIEAYWKSVHWPGEGVFVGEPLARPFGTKVSYQGSRLTLVTTILKPNARYELWGKHPTTDSWELVRESKALAVSTYTRKTISIDPMQHTAYELRALPW